MRNGIVADAVCISSVVCEYFIFMLYLLLLKVLLFTLLFPSFFITLHSFHQSGLVEMIFSISLILSDDPIVDFVVFIEALLFFRLEKQITGDIEGRIWWWVEDEIACSLKTGLEAD